VLAPDIFLMPKKNNLVIFVSLSLFDHVNLLNRLLEVPNYFSFPFPLRFLFASRPAIMGKVLGIVYRVVATHLIKKAGQTHCCPRVVKILMRLPDGNISAAHPSVLYSRLIRHHESLPS